MLVFVTGVEECCVFRQSVGPAEVHKAGTLWAACQPRCTGLVYYRRGRCGSGVGLIHSGTGARRYNIGDEAVPTALGHGVCRQGA